MRKENGQFCILGHFRVSFACEDALSGIFSEIAGGKFSSADETFVDYKSNTHPKCMWPTDRHYRFWGEKVNRKPVVVSHSNMISKSSGKLTTPVAFSGMKFLPAKMMKKRSYCSLWKIVGRTMQELGHHQRKILPAYNLKNQDMHGVGADHT